MTRREQKGNFAEKFVKNNLFENGSKLAQVFIQVQNIDK